jgi:hypothetical protein
MESLDAWCPASGGWESQQDAVSPLPTHSGRLGSTAAIIAGGVATCVGPWKCSLLRNSQTWQPTDAQQDGIAAREGRRLGFFCHR